MSSQPTMNTRTDQGVSSRSYELRCTDCSFEATVEGDVFAVLDVIEGHQERYVNDPIEHFVEFECEEAT